MKSGRVIAVLGCVILTGAGAYAQEGANGRMGEAQLREEAAVRDATRQREVIESILAARQAASPRPMSARLREALSAKLASVPLARLEAFAGAGGLGNIDALVPNAVGAAGTDLVFTPVTPCRIINTTVAGGPIAGNTTRNFFVNGSTAGTFEGQGGTAGGCGIPDAATSVAVNFIAVGPAGAGDLRAFPWNATPTVPNASVINYANVPGLNIANGVIQPVCNAAVTTCTFDLIVQADVSAAHLVVDVVGYFAALNRSEVVAVKASGRTGSVPISTTAATMNSLTVTFPGPGTAIITAQAEINSATANNYINCNLKEGATNLFNWDWEGGDVDGFYDQFQTTSNAVTVSAAGTKAYSFACSTSIGTAQSYYNQLFVTFYGASLP